MKLKNGKIMATLTLELPQKNKKQIIDLLQQFDFIKINNKKNFKMKFEKELKQSFSEMESIEKGTLKPISIEEFFHELENG